jgi:hypothetical protein
VHRLLLALLAASTGCALLARDHPCWPWLEHRFEGQVPPAVVRQLAREPRARRRVGRHRAPAGFYYHPARPPTLDGPLVHEVTDGWELAPCPGIRPLDPGQEPASGRASGRPPPP